MNISEAAKEVLDQLGEVVKQLDRNSYCRLIPRLGNSSLGQHVRHTLEFFICMKEGIPKGIINYDQRARDKNLEENPESALTSIQKIQNFIDSIDPSRLLKLEVNYGLQEGGYQLLETNASRELAYNIEHAVHHMAIIKIGLSEIPTSVNIPEGFGIAVSTLRFRKGQVQHT